MSIRTLDDLHSKYTEEQIAEMAREVDRESVVEMQKMLDEADADPDEVVLIPDAEVEEMEKRKEILDNRIEVLEMKKEIQKAKEPYAEALATGALSAEEMMDMYSFEELREKYQELEKEKAKNARPDPQASDPNAGKHSIEGEEAQATDLDSDSEFMIEEMEEEGGVWSEIAEELMEE